MAVLAQCLIHDVRSDGGCGEGLQHRGELHTRSDLEEFPEAEP